MPDARYDPRSEKRYEDPRAAKQQVPSLWFLLARAEGQVKAIETVLDDGQALIDENCTEKAQSVTLEAAVSIAIEELAKLCDRLEVVHHRMVTIKGLVK